MKMNHKFNMKLKNSPNIINIPNIIVCSLIVKLQKVNQIQYLKHILVLQSHLKNQIIKIDTKNMNITTYKTTSVHYVNI